MATCDFFKVIIAEDALTFDKWVMTCPKTEKMLAACYSIMRVALHLLAQQVAFIITYFDALNGFYWPWTNLQLLRHISYAL